MRCAPPFGAVAARRCLASLGSNPRYVAVYTLSRRAPSATRTPHRFDSLFGAWNLTLFIPYFGVGPRLAYQLWLTTGGMIGKLFDDYNTNF